ncbi:MAG TPA: peptidoglycan DD-metalloendopeptidase family protein [Burkholderiales bacterium]|nr:peptidoglycan DD-metalloendopeptidase family protein [Burkholderiales bacterium]
MLLGSARADETGAVPGGIARIRLGTDDKAPVARLGDTRVLVMREGAQWSAIVGVPLLAEAGAVLTLDIEHADGRRDSAQIRVAAKTYPEQHLTIPPERDDLSPAQMEQFEREREHLSKLLRTFSDTAPASLHLVAPVRGRRTGSFGRRRTINGSPRAPHAGLDIAAPAGTRVAAAAAGRTVDAGNYLFLGETILLDHGQGLMSLYAHLRRKDVHAGDVVAAGAAIGEVGASGRASGPHLHFAVYLNATAVDPRILLAS